MSTNYNNEEMDQLVRKYFTHGLRKGYIRRKGTFLPEYYETIEDKVNKFETRESDIFVASFPKTGTTWTQEMVWLIVNNLDYEGAKQELYWRFPFLEHTCIFDLRDFTKNNPDVEFPPFAIKSVDFINDITGNRLIKTHLPYDLLPEDIREGKKSPKIIYVTRDPKDCLVSYYHHCRLIEGFTGNFDDFFKLFISDRVLFAPFWPHVLSYYKQKENKNILFLKYEDMKADLLGSVSKVASFFDKKYSQDQLEKLCDHLSFENMKNNKAVNYEPILEFNKMHKFSSGDGKFMRSGQVGDFKTIMSKEQIEIIDEWTKSILSANNFRK